MGSLSSLVLELRSVDTTKVLYFSLGNIISEVIDAGKIKISFYIFKDLCILNIFVVLGVFVKIWGLSNLGIYVYLICRK